uniref:Nuclear casein kinase and cyclin dependent kinase substrate 1 n=1 Tax=Callorhinchus milii TaxID=7868 RepID=A0A4W3H0Y3_CALMI
MLVCHISTFFFSLKGWLTKTQGSLQNSARPVQHCLLMDFSVIPEEAYGRDSPPPTKRARASPREGKTKRKSAKNARDESDESDDKVYEKDLKAAIALSKKDTSHSPAGDNESADEKEVHKDGRQKRQAASKAASKQREILLDDGGSDEEHDEDEEAIQEKGDSGSDADFYVEEDDDSDYESSLKKSKKGRKTKVVPEKKEKKTPKPRLSATGKPRNLTERCCSFTNSVS